MSSSAGVGGDPRLPDPSLLMQLALAHRASAVLFAAAELDVFTALGDGPKTSEELARICGAKLAPMRLLLDACAADGLLTNEGERYGNSPVVDAYLVRGRPAYIANGLKFAEDLYPAWGALADLVRTGRPVMPHDTVLGEDKEKTRAFVYAMHERARGMSAVLPHGADFTGRRHLLDVGGGPGTYSIALIRQTPTLRATVLDRPGVLEITREIVEANGCSDRIDLLPGDYHSSPFGSGYDAALLSGMMHRETPDACRMLLRKTFDALESGGLAVVSDVFFDDDRKNSPRFATYFALNMMLMSDDGSAHAKTEMARWMADTGFRDVQVRDLPAPNPHSLVLGTRP